MPVGPGADGRRSLGARSPRGEDHEQVAEADEAVTVEVVEDVGRGMDAFRSQKVPNDREFVTHVFGSMRWEPEQFMLRRVRIDYPLYGAQVSMVFDRPPAE